MVSRGYNDCEFLEKNNKNFSVNRFFSSDERSECGDSDIDNPDYGDGDTSLTAHHKSD